MNNTTGPYEKHHTNISSEASSQSDEIFCAHFSNGRTFATMTLTVTSKQSILIPEVIRNYASHDMYDQSFNSPSLLF